MQQSAQKKEPKCYAEKKILVLGWLARYGTHIPSLSIILFQTAVNHKMSKQEIAHYRFRCPHNVGGRGIILNIDRHAALVLSTEL